MAIKLWLSPFPIVSVSGSVKMGSAVESASGVYVDANVEPEQPRDEICTENNVLRSLGHAVIAVDRHGKITHWNQSAEALFGWAASDIVGKNSQDIVSSIFFLPDSDVLSRIWSAEPWTGEVTVKKRDGTLFEVILSKRPIVDGGGFTVGFVGSVTDVSNLKWMQQVTEEAVKAVSEMNEKLYVVGSLTRHDIRNKLSALNCRGYLLEKRFRDNPEVLAQVREIGLVSKQILSILEFERFYVQVGSEEVKLVDAGQLLDEAAALFSGLKGARLINGCHGLTVLADSLLRQVFYNLIDNTLKYGEKVTKITLRFVEKQDGLKLIYEDDGVGINAETKSTLFTEGHGKGTGYGLYLIKRICEAYGWAIQETGVAGKGAQFTMTVLNGELEGKRRYQTIGSD